MNAGSDALEYADAAFAEALAEALDMREHETGDHSKRVACHTQLLARRFSSVCCFTIPLSPPMHLPTNIT